ncbi:MAG TPA: hypothetical protein VKB34_21770, partial [Povalibacter sp.]|nr:hypothetical protein [Povalibacter sp.]
FDAPDEVIIDESAFAAVAAADWPQLQFRLHPSVQIVTLTTNAPALFKALSEDTTPPSPALLDAPQPWLIWRDELTPRYRSLNADETAALRTVMAQGTFEDICAALCDWHSATDAAVCAATLLRGWLSGKMLTAATVAVVAPELSPAPSSGAPVSD